MIKGSCMSWQVVPLSPSGLKTPRIGHNIKLHAPVSI